MTLVLTTTFAVCLWVALWATGIKSFDGLLLAVAIVLLAATVKSVWQHLPGNRPER